MPYKDPEDYRRWKESHKHLQQEYVQKWADNSRFGGNRRKALKRDNYTCQSCGITDKEHRIKYPRYGITVDHIDGKGYYSKEKNHSLDNLITLCLKCHTRKDNLLRNKKRRQLENKSLLVEEK